MLIALIASLGIEKGVGYVYVRNNSWRVKGISVARQPWHFHDSADPWLYYDIRVDIMSLPSLWNVEAVHEA